ncbi:hypothetical protein AXG93_1712s1760 [Marchantia polymorpha subsp. ruderalis]|uniref:Uncharacterized protein n=1 Tax=Marchantia polymorpha subsp. ruderalis TaxID=1480154 RepID=A0A176W1C6_MARPO|nr:hypothetical protein AXG93_1712s1760 [Marchantia polymorpha subsp. ruderalis]
MSRVKKSREAYDAAVKRAERLIAIAEKREKKHIEDPAALEVRRAEEAHIAEELRGKLAGTKTAEEDLRRRISTSVARERAATLSAECAAVKATLREREAQLREKETECEVLQLNLEKESGRCAELEETCGGLRTSNENAQKVTVDLMSRVEKSREAYDAAVKRAERLIATAEKREKKHIEDLAALEVRRAEEARIAEELRGKLAEELSASLSAGNQKHEDELKDWAKKLAEYESAKSSEVEC